jgi:peptidoglycan/LPS O-acetylase OafA/YrhL
MSLIADALVNESPSNAQALHVPLHKVTNSQPRFYRPELDILRLFAFLAVFVHHGINQLSPVVSRAGAFGLSLFFLLSAFLITELLQREKAATGNIAIRDFYIRRSLRIWPLYYGFLLFIFVLGLVSPSHRAPWGFLPSFALMIGNIYIGRHGFASSPSGFLWSISVEEQFYLFWPLLNRHFSRRWLGRVGLLAFPVGSIAVLVLTAQKASAPLGIWTNAFVQFQMFACGVLLSLGLHGFIPRFSTASRVGLLTIGCALWFTAAQWSGINDVNTSGALGPLIGYYLVGLGCVALFLSAYGIPSRRIPDQVIFLGKISFGLYVFHQLSLDVSSYIFNHIPSTNSETHHIRYGIGHLLLGLLLSIAAAVLSYRYFETPFLKMKESFAVIRSRSI